MLAIFAAAEGTQTAFILFGCSLFAAALFVYIFYRPDDAEQGEAKTRLSYRDERKEATYENLRDLQFEFRVGKLSDADYQHTKLDLQRELAGVMAEIDKLKSTLSKAAPPAPVASPGVTPW